MFKALRGYSRGSLCSVKFGWLSTCLNVPSWQFASMVELWPATSMQLINFHGIGQYMHLSILHTVLASCRADLV